MRIYLVRHGDAIPEDEAGSDRDRWLSRTGRDAVRVLAKLLRDQGVAPDAFVCSPLPRAVQTAELLAHGLDFPGDVASLRALEPSGSPRVAMRDLSAHGDAIIVVSHEPIVSGLAAVIVGRESFPPFRTAQCCAFDGARAVWSARSDLEEVAPLQHA